MNRTFQPGCPHCYQTLPAASPGQSNLICPGCQKPVPTAPEFSRFRCPRCGSKKTWCYSIHLEQYSRESGLEEDKRDHHCQCRKCQSFFWHQSGYETGQNGDFLVNGNQESLSPELREALETFSHTGRPVVSR